MSSVMSLYSSLQGCWAFEGSLYSEMQHCWAFADSFVDLFELAMSSAMVSLYSSLQGCWAFAGSLYSETQYCWAFASSFVDAVVFGTQLLLTVILFCSRLLQAILLLLQACVFGFLFFIWLCFILYIAEKILKGSRKVPLMETKAAAKILEKYHEKLVEAKANLAAGCVVDLVEATKKEWQEAATKQPNVLPSSLLRSIEPVNAKDDALRLFERLLKTQRKFKANGLPSKVDIGYHYTDERNMKTIRTNGLLTRAERTSKRIFPTSNGIFFGDGIYTANHPAFNQNQSYGNVGLIVARLQGESVRVLDDKKKGTEEANTVIGNKGAVSLSNWPATDQGDEIVLKSSAQCVPMVRFDSAIVSGHIGSEEYVARLADSLRDIFEELLNEGALPSPIHR